VLRSTPNLVRAAHPALRLDDITYDVDLALA